MNICLKYLKMKMNIHFRTNVHPCRLQFFQAPSYALLVFVPYAAPRSIHYRSITKSLRSDNKILYHPCSILLEMKMNIGSTIFNKLLWFQYWKVCLMYSILAILRFNQMKNIVENSKRNRELLNKRDNYELAYFNKELLKEI